MMGHLFSFHNEAREIYKHARKMTEALVKAGKISPERAEAAFRERAGQRLTKIGLPLPKDWK